MTKHTDHCDEPNDTEGSPNSGAQLVAAEQVVEREKLRRHFPCQQTYSYKSSREELQDGYPGAYLNEQTRKRRY
jgi:hypothetical protein